MEPEETQNGVTGVPRQVFEKFLKDLQEKGVVADVITRLQKTLIDQSSTSEASVKQALFGDSNIDI